MVQEMITGLDLARAFYKEIVSPVIAANEANLQYTAGILGAGSEVLRCDDELSRDHDWGPRCQIYLQPSDFKRKKSELEVLLHDTVPAAFRGWPTRDIPGGRYAPIRILDMEEYFLSLTGVPVGQWSPVEWLTIHEHHLLGVISGELFRDDLGMQDLRDKLAFYPDDLRLYLIAAEWRKIEQEQAFPARAGMLGAEAGSAIVGARLAESAMRIWFYVHRQYPPYSKWFGVKFLNLPGAETVNKSILGMLSASSWRKRDEHWSTVLRHLLSLHEEHGLLAAGRYKPARVYGGGGRFGTGIPELPEDGMPTMGELMDEIRNAITDQEILRLPKAIGSVNQISSMTDILDSREFTRQLKVLYRK